MHQIYRLILSLDLIMWYIRILHFLLVFKAIGPKLVMIEKMMTDLVFFVSIISVFVSSFGIATQATLYPKSPGNLNLVKGIINKAYWPIYGDMKIFDDLDNENCANNPEGCPEPTGVIFSYIALMIYMAIANLLLINLLIAMFRYFFVFFYR
jgi:transient receptor potential cation channel subfamily M protein 2